MCLTQKYSFVLVLKSIYIDRYILGFIIKYFPWHTFKHVLLAALTVVVYNNKEIITEMNKKTVLRKKRKKRKETVTLHR